MKNFGLGIMNIKTPLISVPLKFGSTGAILIIIMFLVFYFSNDNPLGQMGMFDFFILPIFLFLGIKEYRDTYSGRLLEFWQGMTLGFIIYLSMAIITSLFILFFVSVINPEVMNTYVVSRIDILNESKVGMIEDISEQAFLDSLAEIRSLSLADIVLDNFLKKALLGLGLTIAIAVIMKRKPKTEINYPEVEQSGS